MAKAIRFLIYLLTLKAIFTAAVARRKHRKRMVIRLERSRSYIQMKMVEM